MMRTTGLRRPLALVGLLLLAPVVATAQSNDNAAARATIESQLRAFLADDGALAYSFAAPNVKQVFPDVGRFMDMVKGGYAPVYRPQEWSFGRNQILADGSQVQELLLSDKTGKNWRAIYTLEKQADGNWRITGVSLQGLPGLTM